MEKIKIFLAYYYKNDHVHICMDRFTWIVGHSSVFIVLIFAIPKNSKISFQQEIIFKISRHIISEYKVF